MYEETQFLVSASVWEKCLKILEIYESPPNNDEHTWDVDLAKAAIELAKEMQIDKHEDEIPF